MAQNNYEHINKCKAMLHCLMREDGCDPTQAKKELVDAVKELDIVFSDSDLCRASYGEVNPCEDEQKIYEFVKQRMIQVFFDGDERANLICIHQDNAIVYRFYFKYLGTEFMITVPNIEAIEEDSLESAHYGQYTLQCGGPHGETVILRESYNSKDIQNAISDFVKNHDMDNEEQKKTVTLKLTESEFEALVHKLSWMKCVVRDMNLNYEDYCNGDCDGNCDRKDLCDIESWLKSKVIG